MKKLIKVMLCTFMCLVVLTGCSNDADYFSDFKFVYLDFESGLDLVGVQYKITNTTSENWIKEQGIIKDVCRLEMGSNKYDWHYPYNLNSGRMEALGFETRETAKPSTMNNMYGGDEKNVIAFFAVNANDFTEDMKTCKLIIESNFAKYTKNDISYNDFKIIKIESSLHYLDSLRSPKYE